MPYSPSGMNQMVQALAGVVTHVSVHSGYPGTTGANEVTGGGYGRDSVSWTTPAAGAVASDGALSFSIPAGVTAYYLGFWSGATGGTFYGWAPLGPAAYGAAHAAASGDALTSAAHGLANGMRVVVYTVGGDALPGGLAAGTVYFVVGAAADSFQVSLTSGGSPVNVTTDGPVGYQRVTPEPFASAGVLSVPVGSLSLSAAFAS